MHRWLMASALGLTALALNGSADPVAAQSKDAPGWLKDLNAARLEAKKTGKPMFLVFR
jgi:hypothetical protein